MEHSQRSGFSQGQSPSQIRGKGSSGLFTTLSTCLFTLDAIKLAKVIKISPRNRPKITLKGYWLAVARKEDNQTHRKNQIILWYYMTR